MTAGFAISPFAGFSSIAAEFPALPPLDLADRFMPGLVLGVIGEWLPVFITPIWILSMGLLLGAAALIVVYGILSCLSFIPALGNLADTPRTAITASLILGAGFSAFLCYQYIPTVDQHGGTLYMPLIAIGLMLGFGVIYGMWHRTRSEWYSILGEGVIPYLLATMGVFALIGLSGSMIVEKPMEILNSVPNVNLVGDGTRTVTVEIPGYEGEDSDASPFVPANLDYDLRSTAELRILSDASIRLGDSDDPAKFQRVPTKLDPDAEKVYNYENRDTPPIPGQSNRLHIQNHEAVTATVQFTFKNTPMVPRAAAIVIAAVALFLLITGLVAFRQAAPRVWALALSTAKNEMAQPLYLLLLAIGMLVMVIFAIMPFNTLGDDIRVLKDCGVTTIMLLGMIQAVWSAGTSVSEEIEGRTALTVLSKPVSRRSFILGKYAGIMLAILVMFFIVSAILLVLMSYKPIFEARENSAADAVWALGLDEIMSTVPVIGLYFMETMVIGAIAVALATRLPLLANFITCFTVYVVGHLTSTLVGSAQGSNELVGFVGRLIAVVVPNLNVFNVQAAVDTGNAIPIIYLAGSFNYLICFVVAIWMLAMLLFEDRDLA